MKKTFTEQYLTGRRPAIEESSKVHTASYIADMAMQLSILARQMHLLKVEELLLAASADAIASVRDESVQ